MRRESEMGITQNWVCQRVAAAAVLYQRTQLTPNFHRIGHCGHQS